jgi:hypothetical protein
MRIKLSPHRTKPLLYSMYKYHCHQLAHVCSLQGKVMSTEPVPNMVADLTDLHWIIVSVHYMFSTELMSSNCTTLKYWYNYCSLIQRSFTQFPASFSAFAWVQSSEIGEVLDDSVPPYLDTSCFSRRSRTRTKPMNLSCQTAKKQVYKIIYSIMISWSRDR